MSGRPPPLNHHPTSRDEVHLPAMPSIPAFHIKDASMFRIATLSALYFAAMGMFLTAYAMLPAAS